METTRSANEETNVRISQTASLERMEDSFWKEGVIMLIDTYFKKDDKEKSRSLASRGVREREEGLVTGEMGLLELGEKDPMSRTFSTSLLSLGE